MGASLTENGVSSNVVASSGFSFVNITTVNTNVNAGSIALPSSGIWIVGYQSRIGGRDMAIYLQCALSTSTSSSDVFSTYRMLTERVDNEGTSNLNIGQWSTWYIDVANGNTGGKTIYVNVGVSSGSTTAAFLQDDVNGQTGIIAWKIRESTTSGTGVSNVGI